MNHLLQRVKELSARDLTYKSLGDFVRSIEVDSLNYKSDVPPADPQLAYSRNILCMEPFEVAVLHWNPETQSAIHYHKDFYGYVLVVEGECDNIEYEHKGNQLIEKHGTRGIKGGVLAEPEGVIHKLKNPNPEKPLITIHFYHPALASLDGMKIYSESGTLGVLSDKANTASFDEGPDCFRELRENAFEFVPINQAMKASHRIYPVIPKPEQEKISSMLDSYYAEQAAFYDSFDLKHKSRKAYNEAINKLIAEDLDKDTSSVLSLASGTGRRALEIRQNSGQSYEIMGIDLSPAMCRVAEQRGLNTIVGNLLEVPFPQLQFDIVTFLYAFGHISGATNRRKILDKIYHALVPGGAVFFDVFNVDNRNEWGPDALEYYKRYNLDQYGYDAGDVFYKKVGGKQIAYLHYFSEEELTDLLHAAGFEIAYIKYLGYVRKSGEELKSREEGSFFVKAVKPDE